MPLQFDEVVEVFARVLQMRATIVMEQRNGLEYCWMHEFNLAYSWGRFNSESGIERPPKIPDQRSSYHTPRPLPCWFR
jgi:hypothetical protein